jgi:hypothetical protein
MEETHYEKFKKLVAKQKITIHLGINWIADKDKVSFTSPLLQKTDTTLKKLMSFLKDSNSLEVTITNKKPENWRVYYSGTIKNEHGDVLEFENVDNGFCVNMG